MNSVFEGNATYKITSDNGVSDTGYVEMAYDGEKIDIAHANDNNIIIMQLDNDELMELLAIPADPTPLDERIRYDYPKRKSARRKSARKRSPATKKRSKSRRKSPRCD